MKNKDVCREVDGVEPIDVVDMEHLFLLQERLEHLTWPDWRQLGIIKAPLIAGCRRTRMTQELLACISNEVEEIREHLPWKHWKKYTRQMVKDLGYVDNGNERVKEIQYEFIDLLHFLVALMLLWGISPCDMRRIYGEKMAVNIKRQEDGYDSKEGE